MHSHVHAHTCAGPISILPVQAHVCTGVLGGRMPCLTITTRLLCPCHLHNLQYHQAATVLTVHMYVLNVVLE